MAQPKTLADAINLAKELERSTPSQGQVMFYNNRGRYNNNRGHYNNSNQNYNYSRTNRQNTNTHNNNYNNNNLVKKGQTFEWNEECQKAFELLKSKLINPPILQYPRFTEKFIITCAVQTML